MSTGGQPAGGDGGGQGGAPAVPWGGVGEGQTWEVGGKPWYEVAIAEPEVRDAIKAKNYAHPGVLAKSYAELERTIASRDDSKMIRIPDEGADPKDWDAVYARLGRPASTDGYKDVKFGENADPRMVDFAKQIGFKFGLSPARLEQMAGEWNALTTKLNGDNEAATAIAIETALNELKTSWGGKFDENRARGVAVLKALDKAGFSDADFAAIERHTGIAPVAKLLATLGKLTGEGNFLDPQGQGGQMDPNNATPEQAKQEIQRLTADKDFQKTYMSPNEPGHKEAVARMEALYRKQGGTPVTS